MCVEGLLYVLEALWTCVEMWNDDQRKHVARVVTELKDGDSERRRGVVRNFMAG